MTYKGKIAGIGNAKTRENEITSDDIGTLRKYLVGWDYGIIKTLHIVNTNEVSKIKITVNKNEGLVIEYPNDYQGTTFKIEDGVLIAETDSQLEQIEIQLINRKLIREM